MSVVVPSAWIGALPTTRSSLVGKVCATFGFSDSDTDLAQKALNALDDAVKEFNTALFDFNKVAESGIPLVTGQQWVLLSSQVHWVSNAYLVDNTQGDQTPLVELPWDHFKRLYPNGQEMGRPKVFASFNLDLDGRIYLYQTPTQEIVDQFTLAVEYYRRIPLISSVGANTSIEVPSEIENTLLYGAKKRVAIDIDGAGSPSVNSFASLEQQSLDRLKRSDRTRPNEQRRWRLVDNAYNVRYR